MFSLCEMGFQYKHLTDYFNSQVNFIIPQNIITSRSSFAPFFERNLISQLRSKVIETHFGMKYGACYVQFKVYLPIMMLSTLISCDRSKHAGEWVISGDLKRKDDSTKRPQKTETDLIIRSNRFFSPSELFQSECFWFMLKLWRLFMVYKVNCLLNDPSSSFYAIELVIIIICAFLFPSISFTLPNILFLDS